MRITKVINLSYNAASSATASVNVGFRVKTIHIKNIAYQASLPLGANTDVYFSVSSDITNWQPMGFTINDTTTGIPSASDLQIDFPSPVLINGTYTFILTLLSGLPFTSNGQCYLGIIVEFNDESEPQ